MFGSRALQKPTELGWGAAVGKGTNSAGKKDAVSELTKGKMRQAFNWGRGGGESQEPQEETTKVGRKHSG